MSKIDCNSCQELRDNAPEFVQNGVTDRVCASIKNNTGFNPSLPVSNNNCEDFDAANDCLIGELDDQIEAYDVCDWKQFMHKLLPNLYELLKGFICWLCALQTRLDCLMRALYNQEFFTPIVTSPRSEGMGGDAYWENATSPQTVHFYMDSINGNDGSIVADKNYTCIVSWCNNFRNLDSDTITRIIATLHTSSVPYTDDYKDKYAMHARQFNGNSSISIPMTSACKVKKGDHLVVEFDGLSSNTGEARMHQFIITWIPDFQIEVDCR